MDTERIDGMDEFTLETKVPIVRGGIVRWVNKEDHDRFKNLPASAAVRDFNSSGLSNFPGEEAKPREPQQLRNIIGDVIREIRKEKNMNLRTLSNASYTSLGYLSEVERGQKEASSEIINQICSGLDIHLYELLFKVAERSRASAITVPDTIPNEILEEVLTGIPS